MSKGLQWIIGIGVVLVVAVIVFSAIAPYVVGIQGWPRQELGRVPAWMMRPGDLDGRLGRVPFGRGGMGGRLGWMPFGRGTFFLPLLALGAIGLGVLWLALRRRTPARPAEQPTTPCVECGQPVLATWKACPYCGTKRE